MALFCKVNPVGAKINLGSASFNQNFQPNADVDGDVDVDLIYWY